MAYWKPHKGVHPVEIRGRLVAVEELPHTRSTQYEAFLEWNDGSWSVGILGYKLKNAFEMAHPKIGARVGIRFLGESQGYLDCLVVTDDPTGMPDSFEEWADEVST